MNNEALSKFVEQVLVDSEQKFGPNAEKVLLEGYAREAVLQLWLEKPQITWFTAYKAFLQLHNVITERFENDRRDREVGNLSRLGNCACAGGERSPIASTDDEERAWLLDIA
jgi:hypothetical protein